MKEKKIVISKELKDIIQKKGNDTLMYSQLIFEITGIKSKDFFKKRVEISLKDFLFLNAVYEVNKFDNSKEINFLALKKEIDNNKGKESYTNYGIRLMSSDKSSDALNKELNRGKITKTFIEPMIEKGVIKIYDEEKIKIDKICQLANDILEYNRNNFEESYSYKQEIEILFEKLRKMNIEDLKEVYKNIVAYCYIDMCDWILLGLWQKIGYKHKNELLDFIDCITLPREKRISLKNKKFKDYHFKSSLVDILKDDDNKNKILNKIKQRLVNFFKSNKNQLINYTYLMNLSKRIEFLIYLTKSDWKLLKKLGRLRNLKNRKKYYQKKIWCIKYAKGLIFESIIK